MTPRRRGTTRPAGKGGAPGLLRRAAFPAAGLLVALGAPGGGAAQAPARTLPITRAEFSEERVPRTQVSGSVRAGVLAGDLVESVDPARLVLRIPAGAEDRLCVDIRSANGEYHGRIERSLEGIEPGDYRVELPTGEAAFFRAHDANEIAVLAVAAPSCLDAPRTVLLASWSGGIATDGFWVFVNSNRNRAHIEVVDVDGARHEFPCQRAPVELAVIFDQRCRVAIPPSRTSEVSIERRAGLGSRLPSVKLPVRW